MQGVPYLLKCGGLELLGRSHEKENSGGSAKGLQAVECRERSDGAQSGLAGMVLCGVEWSVGTRSGGNGGNGRRQVISVGIARALLLRFAVASAQR